MSVSVFQHRYYVAHSLKHNTLEKQGTSLQKFQIILIIKQVYVTGAVIEDSYP